MKHLTQSFCEGHLPSLSLPSPFLPFFSSLRYIVGWMDTLHVTRSRVSKSFRSSFKHLFGSRVNLWICFFSFFLLSPFLYFFPFPFLLSFSFLLPVLSFPLPSFSILLPLLSFPLHSPFRSFSCPFSFLSPCVSPPFLSHIVQRRPMLGIVEVVAVRSNEF